MEFQVRKKVMIAIKPQVYHTVPLITILIAIQPSPTWHYMPIIIEIVSLRRATSVRGR